MESDPKIQPNSSGQFMPWSESINKSTDSWFQVLLNVNANVHLRRLCETLGASKPFKSPFARAR